jgi:hypothetical protein
LQCPTGTTLLLCVVFMSMCVLQTWRRSAGPCLPAFRQYGCASMSSGDSAVFVSRAYAGAHPALLPPVTGLGLVQHCLLTEEPPGTFVEQHAHVHWPLSAETVGHLLLSWFAGSPLHICCICAEQQNHCCPACVHIQCDVCVCLMPRPAVSQQVSCWACWRCLGVCQGCVVCAAESGMHSILLINVHTVWFRTFWQSCNKAGPLAWF